MFVILELIFLLDSEAEERTCTTVFSDGELLIPPTDKDPSMNYPIPLLYDISGIPDSSRECPGGSSEWDSRGAFIL